MRYFNTVKNTPENRMMLTMLNDFQTMSSDINPDGNIRTMQTHTPAAHVMLMSRDDLRRIILTMSGILNSGKVTAAMRPIVSIIKNFLLSS